MDKIIAKAMKFKGCHGVMAQERTAPQEFWIDLELDLDLRPAAIKDDLKLTIDYNQIFHMVRKIVENESYNLIEALAEKIAQTILEYSSVSSVQVTVYKPNAPVVGIFDYFAVKIRRSQDK